MRHTGKLARGRPIGIDFDNTLVDYGDLFVRAACNRGYLDEQTPAIKLAVRTALRRQPDGELRWQQVQRDVYGYLIAQAQPYAGALAFLRRCRAQGYRLLLVSHKTQHGGETLAQAEERRDLRAAARQWLSAHGLIGDVFAAGDVHFCDTRSAKIACIVAGDCVAFIDDLQEVFDDAGFPAGTRRVLFDPAGQASAGAPCEVFSSFAEIDRALLDA